MPKVEHCIETLLNIFASSFLLPSFWQFSWDACCLPCGFLEKPDVLQGRMCLQQNSQKTNTEMDLCVPWPNGFSVCNTSHPAQRMASVLNVHPCISQAILLLSCWRSEATIKCRQPYSRVCSLTCNLVYEDESGKRCKC